MRQLPACFWIMLLTLLTLTSVSAVPHRTALVIGNSMYQKGPLRNPVNDATDIAETLRQLEFDVTLLRDVHLHQMEDALTAFNRELRQGGLGLFYFAGHGVQVAGENYLIPLGTRIDREQDVRYEALPVGQVLGAMEDAGNGLNIVILDACRNNPFARSWRSDRRGLAVVQATRGSLIAYATEPGGLANDGDGRNGVYTHHLLLNLPTPGLPVEQMFKQVRIGVLLASGGKQTPWESSSLTGNVSFHPVTPALSPTAKESPPSSSSPRLSVTPTAFTFEVEMWKMVKDSPYTEDFKYFLKTYPEGRFAPHARLKLDQLERHQPQGSLPSPPPNELPQPTEVDEQLFDASGQQQEPRFESEQIHLEASFQRVEGAPQVTSTQVRQAQKQLKLAGFDPGPSDGLFGPRTTTSIRQYQMQQGLPVTGRLDDITRQSLSATEQRWPISHPQRVEGLQRADQNQQMDPAAQKVAHYIRQLRSTNSVQKRKATQAVYRSAYSRHPKILEAANAELLQGYNTKTRDSSHIDAMAWLCRILGAAGDQVYSATLNKVANQTRSRKLKKYALKNYKKLQ